ncbi:hypothetical protein FOE78_10635 [Microlunatus elymi]|uniref:Uncharacterized protein n=1 Tax=Microlunatus elymi TaxID=2596828 RepID=A0A516PYP8_9ACTN|nr:hypothetical protein [Microlunatus elymi]QDP96294.1 hypothetical protein FOE78_10635 [Microlunatus elymi]
MLYPRSWRNRHGEEARAILVERARDRDGRISWADSTDLVLQAIMARLDTAAAPLLGRLPGAARAVPGLIALTIATAASMIMFAGEVSGALHRPAVPPYQVMFISGPFLTIGVGIDIGFMLTMAILVSGRIQWARVTLLATTILALWMTVPTGLLPYPQPPAAYTGVLAVLGIVGLTGLDPGDRRARLFRRLAGLIVIVLGGTGLVLSAVITGTPGWLPLPGTLSLTAALVSYAVIAAVILIAITTAVYAAVRRHRIGGLLLIMLGAQVVTVLHASAVTVESNPLTVWVWPALCLAINLAVIKIAQRRILLRRPAPAR